jgi:hypothetical protein
MHLIYLESSISFKSDSLPYKVASGSCILALGFFGISSIFHLLYESLFQVLFFSVASFCFPRARIRVKASKLFVDLLSYTFFRIIMISWSLFILKKNKWKQMFFLVMLSCEIKDNIINPFHVISIYKHTSSTR